MRDKFALRPAGDALRQAASATGWSGRWTIRGSTPLADDEEEPAGRILPVYPLTEGLQQWQIRRIVRGVLETYAELLDEVFPAEYLEAPRPLAARSRRCREIHFPSDQESLDQARRRFVYQELFVLQLALALKRRQQQRPAAGPAAGGHGQDRRPHPPAVSLRADRRPASRRSPRSPPTWPGRVPMNRLLQGDVGSGKTVVAVYAMLLAVAHGHQAVLMAPTEVLARQHAQTLERLLAASQVRRGAADRRAAAPSSAASCSSRSPPARSTWSSAPRRSSRRTSAFAKLGLVVIDEQHKFGVRQRADAEARRARPALPGDDRHAHPAHGDHDAVRRPGRLDASRQPAGPAEGATPTWPTRTQRRAVVGVLPQEAPRGPAGLRGHAAGRGVGADRRGQPRRDATRRWPTASWRPSGWA